VQSSGLVFKEDGAGNHSGFLHCGPLEAPTLLLGSHLDSVPQGGQFDGTLGVLSALEVLRVIKENDISLPVNLEAIDFTDEEGTLIGLMGSAALAGNLTIEDLSNPRGGQQNLQVGLDQASLTLDGILNARRNPNDIAGYLELHIEQGPRLINTGADIGIVAGIAGICSCRLTFIGRSDHAGTTPVQNRLDAAQGACGFTLATRKIILEDFPDCVANVGDMQFTPGAFNIIPERVTLALEFRSANSEVFSSIEKKLLARARQEADRFGLDLEVEFLGKHQPAEMSPAVQKAITQAADALGLKSIHLESGAGHDAQSFADICPCGMIFVPSAGGASHSPREFTEWEDCINGANVLLQTTLRLATSIQTIRR
jgi:N-carbamoyl-L-amino-acid hydrolase